MKQLTHSRRFASLAGTQTLEVAQGGKQAATEPENSAEVATKSLLTKTSHGISARAGADLAGTRFGSLIAVLIALIPESGFSELKKSLQLAIPSITVLLSRLSLFILRVFIEPHIEMRPLNKVFDLAKKRYKEACKDPNATEEEKATKRARVEELEQLILEKMRERAVSSLASKTALNHAGPE